MNQKLRDKVKGLLKPATKKSTEIRKLFGRLKIGDNYPIVKLNSYVPITHGPVRPLKEKRELNKPITFETIYDPKEKVNFRGSPISGLTWLEGGDRIGMSGHSYGGFLTAYALTHSKLFVGGIAGAPVTDWRLYDTIYTERYMDIPQNNLEGYEKTSVIKAAKNLHGKLLIVHGVIDDNVHIENTFKFINALQQADKEFELMIYPRSRHGIGGMHYEHLVVNFTKTVLKLDISPAIPHNKRRPDGIEEAFSANLKGDS